jgi:predicted PurR-regulated permease PerM
MLGIAAFIAIFIFTYYAYKTARDYNRKAWLWALAVFGVGFGLQVIVPLMIGIVLGVVLVMSGTPVNEMQEKIQGPASIIGIVSVVLSFVGMALLLKMLSKVPETDDGQVEVPPPPQFGNFEQ